MANAIAAGDPRGSHLCPDAGSTRGLAQSLAHWIRCPMAVALDGPLGAGKTEFVKGLAAGLGCRDTPTSPTFAVAHEYGGGRWPLFHFDFYRLDTEDDVEISGFGECLGEGIVAVEWASKFPLWMPKETIWIRMSIGAGQGREIEIV